MQSLEKMDLLELIDLLEEKTFLYTTVFRDRRNTFEYTILKEEIQKLITLIESKRNMEETQPKPVTAEARTQNLSKKD